MPSNQQRTKAIVNHISRIQGQLETLKKNLQNEEEPYDLATLTTSTIKSFDSLRAKIIENYILSDLAADAEISAHDLERLQTILKIVRA